MYGRRYNRRYRAVRASECPVRGYQCDLPYLDCVSLLYFFLVFLGGEWEMNEEGVE
jgi:hypothetical protein